MTTTTEIRRGIQARLRELADKRQVIEKEEAGLHAALKALGGGRRGGHARSKPKHPTRTTTEREQQIVDLVERHPDRTFDPKGLHDADETIPVSSATHVVRRLIEQEKVAQAGQTSRGVPIIQAKGAKQAPEEIEPLSPQSPGHPDGGAEESVPESQVPPEQRQRTRRRPVRPMKETRKLIVDHLRQHGPTPQNEVAEDLGLASSTMSVAVKALNGAVERSKEPNDGPGWHWLLTLRRREQVTKPGEGTREGRLVR